MNEIIDKIYRYIEQNNMLTDCERVVVGLSGGADSVCLLMVLKGYIERKLSTDRIMCGACQSWHKAGGRR